MIPHAPGESEQVEKLARERMAAAVTLKVPLESRWCGSRLGHRGALAPGRDAREGVRHGGCDWTRAAGLARLPLVDSRHPWE